MTSLTNLDLSRCRGWKVRLVVNNHFEDRKSDNVIGTIYGSEEQGRFVIFGNHRDAWLGIRRRGPEQWDGHHDGGGQSVGRAGDPDGPSCWAGGGDHGLG